MNHIFIPSYRRPNSLKSVKYLKKIGYDCGMITVFIDSEADDIEAYTASCKQLGCHLVVFNMDEARERYDYVHRPSYSRRSAGQARNMFHDYAKEKNIDFFVVMDDDTTGFQKKTLGRNSYAGVAILEEILWQMKETENLMRSKHIGVFGWAQTGDLMATVHKRPFLKKVMNMTFYLHPYIYRGERGVQDDDTSQFVNMYNNGLFTGSYGIGCVLNQEPSATCVGGLTELYNECKLLNKALVTPIQFPSAIKAEYQPKNGGRIHHRIQFRYLMPKVLKGDEKAYNIPWDTYAEDIPFTLEPHRDNCIEHQPFIELL